MDILWKIIVGGIIGWLASIVMKTNAQMGILMNILVGIVGSFLGHLLAGALGFAPASTIGVLLVSLGGAIVLILLLKMLKILK